MSVPILVSERESVVTLTSTFNKQHIDDDGDNDDGDNDDDNDDDGINAEEYDYYEHNHEKS